MSKKQNQKLQKNINKKNYLKIIIPSAAVAIIIFVIFFFIKREKPKFDGKKAFNELVTQVNFGPRICGTAGHDKAEEYLTTKLKQYADLVSDQTFDYTDKHDSTKIYKGVNIVASFNISPDVKTRILLAAHWDSRPFADNDPDSTNQKLPVPAANDGASGVAVLLEMARLFSISEPDVGVDIVLFDLEDIGDASQDIPKAKRNPFGIGSIMFVNKNPNYRPAYGILLDMVGDKNLRIPKEVYSVERAKNIVDKVWNAAKDVNATAFKDEEGVPIMDDHIVFLQHNIPVIDLIHTPFPSYWHTISDTPDKCSSESLQQVGNVLVEVIYNE